MYLVAGTKSFILIKFFGRQLRLETEALLVKQAIEKNSLYNSNLVEVQLLTFSANTNSGCFSNLLPAKSLGTETKMLAIAQFPDLIAKTYWNISSIQLQLTT